MLRLADNHSVPTDTMPRKIQCCNKEQQANRPSIVQRSPTKGNAADPLSAELLDQLRKIDTPTIANALELMDIRPRTDTRQLIEDKQREIEDNALDLLDAAAGGEVDSAIGGADAPDSALPETDETTTSFDLANQVRLTETGESRDATALALPSSCPLIMCIDNWSVPARI